MNNFQSMVVCALALPVIPTWEARLLLGVL
ncbi:hypothetical protein XBP1_1550006 [Xenorhabdus bovienii str. puntauvense]|uniref:Uncharacterized protein n=1 Tax=Xenorhabdus bovienii str. puntauvense TaxID=1398201 RepID=A0A077NC15_XENBV|nr:hypothetical protein XBP1_1550006 [Xenorhabdus bovienii str. puntauvense]